MEVYKIGQLCDINPNAIDVVIAVPKHKCVLSQYLAYYTNSPHGMNSVKANQRRVAQGHLNVTVYGKLPIMLPPLGMQKQVVSKIEENCLSVMESKGRWTPPCNRPKPCGRVF